MEFVDLLLVEIHIDLTTISLVGSAVFTPQEHARDALEFARNVAFHAMAQTARHWSADCKTRCVDGQMYVHTASGANCTKAMSILDHPWASESRWQWEVGGPPVLDLFRSHWATREDNRNGKV
jgi:hypothetical protein